MLTSMADSNLTIPIIISNVNGLNIPTKETVDQNKQTNKRSTVSCLPETNYK